MQKLLLIAYFSITSLLCIWNCEVNGQVLPKCEDIGLQTRFQDNFVPPFGPYNLKRGRATICADFNNDDMVDIFLGNPGDESFVMINTGNHYFPRYEPSGLVLFGDLAWGAAAADYDEDGDIDLFISVGGNEGIGLDYLFRNMLIETGNYSFQDVTAWAGVAGPTLPGKTEPEQVASANAVWVDYDLDNDLDLWVNVNSFGKTPNLLWQNQLRETGEAKFTLVTNAVGLASERAVRTLHSSWSDFDNDGDVDLFENNFRDPNRLWKNMLVETGNAVFVNQTATASLPGHDLGYPINSFGSAAIDFNQDGFDDILCVYRLRTPPGPEPSTSPYGNGHAVFLNDGQGRFANHTNQLVKSSWPLSGGVMGFMVGDLNGDGFPEIYIGNGGPNIKQVDTFLITDGTLDANGFPGYVDGTSVIDFDVPKHPQAPADYYPTYPHRTHGVAFADTNNDGQLEILVANGGMARSIEEVREPNRHYVLDWGQNNFVTVRLVGDGANVNRDGVGARLKLTVKGPGGIRDLYRTNLAGTAFSAQNDIRAINFPIGQANQALSLTVVWPNGRVQKVSKVFLNSKNVVIYGS